MVVASYRQNVQAYQSGGGDYEVATVNLGANAGLGVASALWVDYVLTVAVSISSAAQYLGSAVSVFQGHEVAVAVTGVVLLAAINLRGAKESGTAFAIPTYVFIVSMLAMVAWGFLREFLGDGLPDAETADFTILPEEPFMSGLGGLAFAFLLAARLRLRVRNVDRCRGDRERRAGLPQPKGKNAATTLLILGAVATTLAFSSWSSPTSSTSASPRTRRAAAADRRKPGRCTTITRTRSSGSWRE